MNVYLSIDIGTSSTKVSVYDARGTLLIARSAGYAFDVPQAGWAEQDPDDWWRAVCSLTPEVMAEIAGQRLAAISVSGQAPLCVPVDADGLPLRKAILWLDRRATPQVDWLIANVGEARCIETGANRIDSYFGGLKWLWYRQNEPELFDRTWKIMQANGFVSWKLTGVSAIDPTQAGLCSPCFDITTGHWDPGVCEAMGLPLAMLPEIRPSSAVIGEVHATAAAASGLPVGTPVVCGAGDYACACLGAGVIGQGRGALMLGTAGNLLMPGASNPDPRLLHTHDVAGAPLTFGGVMAGGNLTWFEGLFEGMSGSSASDFFARADEEAARIPAGSEGLLYLPYLMGERTPIWDPEARGAFIGLTSRHTRAHLFRAVLEGVAFAFRQIVEISGSAGLEAIVAIDGGARSALWRSIFASVLGLPVRSGADGAGIGLGSAFLAALGAGDFTDFESISDWARAGDEVRPDPAARRRYDDLYAVYSELYGTLRPAFHALAQ